MHAGTVAVTGLTMNIAEGDFIKGSTPFSSIVKRQYPVWHAYKTMSNAVSKDSAVNASCYRYPFHDQFVNISTSTTCYQTESLSQVIYSVKR